MPFLVAESEANLQAPSHEPDERPLLHIIKEPRQASREAHQSTRMLEEATQAKTNEMAKKKADLNQTFRSAFKLRRQDSNLRPPGYEPDELPSAPPRRDSLNNEGKRLGKLTKSIRMLRENHTSKNKRNGKKKGGPESNIQVCLQVAEAGLEPAASGL